MSPGGSTRTLSSSTVRQLFFEVSWFDCSRLEKSAAIRPFATKKFRLASETILLVDSLATESCRLTDSRGDQTFFQSKQRRCGPNVIAQGAWQSLSVATRKDRRKKDFIRKFRPHGLPQLNREQSGEKRGYMPVPRQQDIGAPVPGTGKVRGEVEEVKGSDWRKQHRGREERRRLI